MTICKGTNQDGSPCRKAVHKTNGEYCWLHVEQAINKSDGPKEIRRVYKMPVDIKIDKITEELDSLRLDLDHLGSKIDLNKATLEDMGEMMNKKARADDLKKTLGNLETWKVENINMEKQFRVPVTQTSSSNVYAVRAVSKGEEVAGTKTFQRAINFQYRQLQSKQRKLDREKDLRNKKKNGSTGRTPPEKRPTQVHDVSDQTP